MKMMKIKKELQGKKESKENEPKLRNFFEV